MATRREQANFEEYERKLKELYYKNEKSALGNIYRAAREKKITISQRNQLIGRAGVRYSTVAAHAKEFNDLSGKRASKKLVVLEKGIIRFKRPEQQPTYLKAESVCSVEPLTDGRCYVCYGVNHRGIVVTENCASVLKKLGWVK